MHIIIRSAIDQYATTPLLALPVAWRGKYYSIITRIFEHAARERIEILITLAYVILYGNNRFRRAKIGT